jgi:hypothetical protein
LSFSDVCKVVILMNCAIFLTLILAAVGVTSAAVALLLGDSMSRDSDGDLDTTLPDVVLGQEELVGLDVDFSDAESDGEQDVSSWQYLHPENRSSLGDEDDDGDKDRLSVVLDCEQSGCGESSRWYCAKSGGGTDIDRVPSIDSEYSSLDC